MLSNHSIVVIYFVVQNAEYGMRVWEGFWGEGTIKTKNITSRTHLFKLYISLKKGRRAYCTVQLKYPRARCAGYLENDLSAEKNIEGL